MPRFSIRNPYFIIVACLVVIVIGVSTVLRMPVDLFPNINLPQVVVATFYNGMPPEDIETEITGRFERFFTLVPQSKNSMMYFFAVTQLPAGSTRSLQFAQEVERGPAG
jgi:multidrug efflux pump subunit AcrB